MNTSQYLTTKEAAAYLKVSVSRMVKWRAEKNSGPLYFTIGKSIRYRITDLDNFVNKQPTRK